MMSSCVSPSPGHGVSLREAVRVWTRVALLSFGGPAGQIAVMHRILVEEKKWLSPARFLHALNYCMLLPGPEAQQLATYIGWLMHGPRGGMIAGGLFVLPGALAIMALSVVYAAYGKLGLVAGLFFGLKAAVLAIVLQAVFRVGAGAEQLVFTRLGAGGVRRDLLLRRSLPRDYSRGGLGRPHWRQGRPSGVSRRRRT
jgi:chromate transporter